jgi:hypothetical protein
MIALAPKCYCFSVEGKETRKAKGAQMNRNNQINLESYINCIRNSCTVSGINVGFRTVKAEGFNDNTYQVIKYEVNKIALSATVLDKMFVFPTHQSCAPIIKGFTNKNYVEIIEI